MSCTMYFFLTAGSKQEKCIAKLTTKPNETCDNKVSTLSITGNYCSVHYKKLEQENKCNSASPTKGLILCKFKRDVTHQTYTPNMN